MVVSRALCSVLGSLDTVFTTAQPLLESKQFFVDGFGDGAMDEELVGKINREGMAGFADLTLEPHDDDSEKEDGAAPSKYALLRLASQLASPVAARLKNRLLAGSTVYGFASPVAEWLPQESKTGYAMVVRPSADVAVKGVVCVLAATGDQGFWLRKVLVADAMANEGYATVILEIAFYGRRKPSAQDQHFLRTGTDISAQAVACGVEGAKLVQHCREKLFPGLPVCLVGTSFGGSMATFSAILLMHGPDSEVPLGLCTFVAPNGPEVLLTGSMRSQVSFANVEEDRLVELFREKDNATLVSRLLPDGMPDACRQTLVHTSIVAESDKIVPLNQATDLEDCMRSISASSKTMRVSGGHVSSIMRTRSILPAAIIATFADMREAGEGVTSAPVPLQ